MDIDKVEPGKASGAANAAAQAAALLTSGNLNDARAVLNSAMQRWPRSLELQLGLAEVAIKEGKPIEGKAILKSLREQFPTQWQPALALASLHLRLKKGNRARWALAEAAALGAPKEAVLRLQASLAHHEGNADEFESSLKSVTQFDSADDRAVMGVLNLLVSQGRSDEAVQFAEETLARDPTSERLYFFLLRSARDREDASRIVEVCERHDQALPTSPKWVAIRIGGLIQLSRNDEAKLHALRHRALWHSDRWIVTAVAGLPWSANERPSVAAQLADIARSGNSSGAVVSACLLGLLALGADQVVRDILAGTRPDRVENIDLLRILLGRVLTGGEAPSFDGPTMVLPRPGSSKCLLVFSGLADSLRIPSPLLHRLIGPLGTHAIYFRDDLRNSYLTGISGMGAGLADAVREIRALLLSLGNPIVYTFGNSSGGFAAIRYGIELGAEAVVVSGAATNLTREQRSDGRRPMDLVPSAGRAMDSRELDLRPILVAANPRPRVLVYHGADGRAETRQARHLAEIDGVELRPVAESRGEGRTMLQMIKSDLLIPALREVMGIDRD